VEKRLIGKTGRGLLRKIRGKQRKNYITVSGHGDDRDGKIRHNSKSYTLVEGGSKCRQGLGEDTAEQEVGLHTGQSLSGAGVRQKRSRFHITRTLKKREKLRHVSCGRGGGLDGLGKHLLIEGDSVSSLRSTRRMGNSDSWSRNASGKRRHHPA